MNATEALKIIEAAGGTVAFARLLGIDGAQGYIQRVNNWKERGIPARVMLEHLVIIESLRRKVAAA